MPHCGGAFSDCTNCIAWDIDKLDEGNVEDVEKFKVTVDLLGASSVESASIDCEVSEQEDSMGRRQ